MRTFVVLVSVLLGFLVHAAPGDAANAAHRCGQRHAACRRTCGTGMVCMAQCMNALNACLDRAPGAGSPLERKLLSLTNTERVKAGLKPLFWDVRLGAAAQGHAANMARQETSAHVLDGMSPVDRIRAERFPFGLVAENIYWGQGSGFTTPEAAVYWWMNSAGHRANILDPRVKALGVGIRTASSGQVHFCQNFGTNE